MAHVAQNTMYTLYAMLPTSTYVRRNCHGIDLETDPNLAGSPTVTRSVNGRPVVDCMGNCATGEGYCYSSYDGRFCAPCKLYNAGPGEVLCATYNVPDGYCRETPEHTCAHDGGVESQNSLPTREACNVNYDAFAAQNAHSPHNQCSGAQTLAQVRGMEPSHVVPPLPPSSFFPLAPALPRLPFLNLCAPHGCTTGTPEP
eukprot:5094913-Pleurochrysis_carterae.AAC.2